MDKVYGEWRGRDDHVLRSTFSLVLVEEWRGRKELGDFFEKKQGWDGIIGKARRWG